MNSSATKPARRGARLIALGQRVNSMPKDRKILLAALGLIVAMGIFPPWQYTFSFKGSHSEESAGFSIIVFPPRPLDSGGAAGVKLDTSRLFVQWLVTIAAAAFWLVLTSGQNKDIVPRLRTPREVFEDRCRNRDVMAEKALAAQQMQGSWQALDGLVRYCRNVYVRAADVLEIHSEELSLLKTLGIMESIDVPLLRPFYRKLCSRYRSTLYDAQMALFPSDQKTPEQIWWAWYFHELMPELLGSAHFVRTVLRSLRLLPCPDPSVALVELDAFLDNLSFEKTYAHPTWPAPL